MGVLCRLGIHKRETFKIVYVFCSRCKKPLIWGIDDISELDLSHEKIMAELNAPYITGGYSEH